MRLDQTEQITFADAVFNDPDMTADQKIKNLGDVIGDRVIDEDHKKEVEEMLARLAKLSPEFAEVWLAGYMSGHTNAILERRFEIVAGDEVAEF